MPTLTPKLGLKKPLGSEYVSRASYNENLDLLDNNAASQADLDAQESALAAHIGAGGEAHAIASPAVAGFMSAADKANLDNLVAGAGIPRGVIVMWSGAIADIPQGWALCDGTNGTPDLRDRFIVGAGGAYGVGNTGGAASVALTANEMPAHSHSASSGSAGSHSHTGSADIAGEHPDHLTSLSLNTLDTQAGTGANRATGGYTYNTVVLGEHSHNLSINGAGSHSHSVFIGSAGGGAAHENRPPYFALAYIMKL